MSRKAVPKVFTRVKIMEKGKEIVVPVVDHLSTQFTIEVNGKIEFLFYQDNGVTWEFDK
jgi:hypothetical protein